MAEAHIFSRSWQLLSSFILSLIVMSAIIVFSTGSQGKGVLLMAQFSTPHDKKRLENYNFTEEWVAKMAPNLVFGYAIYFGVGGFLHWYFYMHQHNSADHWKCQPNKWPEPGMNSYAIMLGTVNMMLGTAVASLLACCTEMGLYTTIYERIQDYGWLWWFLQWPVLFTLHDYTQYWVHRAFHIPFLYKNFHKVHHKFKRPTAFAATALHPVEFLVLEMQQLMFMFIFPVHIVPFTASLLYRYYIGLLQHSGIYFESKWYYPSLLDTLYHDNHHQYFHVNFGEYTDIWDRLHGTLRQKDRIYGEKYFYGKGKQLGDASPEEIREEIQERRSEHSVGAARHKTDVLEKLSILVTKKAL